MIYNDLPIFMWITLSYSYMLFNKEINLWHWLSLLSWQQENRVTNAGRKLESVIVIDSDSEGERDGTRRHHSNTASAPPVPVSPPRSAKESRPDSTGKH